MKSCLHLSVIGWAGLIPWMRRLIFLMMYML